MHLSFLPLSSSELWLINGNSLIYDSKNSMDLKRENRKKSIKIEEKYTNDLIKGSLNYGLASAPPDPSPASVT